jgi:hypothetical protein
MIIGGFDYIQIVRAEIKQTLFHPVRQSWEEETVGRLELVDGVLEYEGDPLYDPRQIPVPVWEDNKVIYITADQEPQRWLENLSSEFRYSFALEVSS